MTRVKTLSELEIEDQDYLEKQRVEQAHREKEPLVIDKRLNDINCYHFFEGDITLIGVDEHGTEFSISVDAYELLQWINTDDIREDLANHILKGKSSNKNNNNTKQNVIVNSTFSNTKNN